MLGKDDKLQADLALFSATLRVTLMRREDILAELEESLQELACRDRPLSELPVVKDAAGLSLSPADTP
jgi:hypothetical protein